MTPGRSSITRRWRLALAFVVLTATTCDTSCSVTGPLDITWGPGGGVPTYPPGSFFFFTSYERAVELGDTLTISVSDAAGAVWTSSDTSIATVSGDAMSAVLRPRRSGYVSIAVQAHGRTLTRMIEVVTTLCGRAEAATPISVGADLAFDLDAADCRLGFDPAFYEWPQGPDGPLYPTLRAEGRRLVLADSTLVRVDAAVTGANPLLTIVDTTGYSVAMRRNPWGRAFVARLLPPGVYTLWVAGEPDRPPSATQLTLRAVSRCSEASTVIGNMTMGVAVEGTLDANDCHDEGGWAQEWWRITIPSDGWYRVSIQPTSTANYHAPQVFQGGGYVSGLPTFLEAGLLRFEASALSDVSYRLRVETCSTATACP